MLKVITMNSSKYFTAPFSWHLLTFSTIFSNWYFLNTLWLTYARMKVAYILFPMHLSKILLEVVLQIKNYSRIKKNHAIKSIIQRDKNVSTYFRCEQWQRYQCLIFLSVGRIEFCNPEIRTVFSVRFDRKRYSCHLHI